MTAKELNRDIKRLGNRYNDLKVVGGDTYYNEIESVKKEFRRLHGADSEATYINLSSMKTMVRMNRELRVLEIHEFYPRL